MQDNKYNTYRGWMKLGRQVKKGQKAIHRINGELVFLKFQTANIK